MGTAVFGELNKFDPIRHEFERRHLTTGDAEAMGVRLATQEETAAFGSRPAMAIPYPDLDGNDMGFFRMRFLDSNAPKYAQRRGSGVHAYFPQSSHFKWSEVAANPALSICITEGEIKAYVACRYGIPTIGLGGVNSYASKKQGDQLLEDLRLFIWEGRSVLIAYDSDVVDKPQVAGASSDLALRLSGLGARPEMVRLPGDGDEKVGLDDYLLKHGLLSFRDLPRESFKHVEQLHRLNARYALSRDPVVIVELDTKRMYSESEFKLLKNKHKAIVRNASGKLVERNAGSQWLVWDYRRECNGVVYAPGDLDISADGRFNLWRGWASPPRQETVELWHLLLDHLFRSEPDESLRAWFERWCAYPIQHPGTKLFTAVVLWSFTEGTGKSLIGELLGSVYGENFSELNDSRALYSTFNPWAAEKQFVLANEVASPDKRADSDVLKGIITRQVVEINLKHKAHYYQRDCINYLLTSNHPDPVFVADTDRRFFIHHVTEERLDRELALRIREWKNSGAAAGALLQYFQHLSVGDFDPHRCAPQTAARNDAIQDNQTELEQFCVAVLTTPPGDAGGENWPFGTCDLWEASEVRSYFEGDNSRRTSTKAIGRALRKAGAHPVDVVNTPMGAKRLFAIRNVDDWKRADHSARAKEYARSRRR